MGEWARGQDGTGRSPGTGNFNPETTVLAHLPCGQKGMGMKGCDTVEVYACSACHDVLDGRGKGEVDWSDVPRALSLTFLLTTRMARPPMRR
ncbi:nuclease domain-containing protein [Pseudomonas sp. 79_C]|uniref:nuclease domain-containing protein n=1 Tax=Pseudomonas sp. 79_C TaxID=2813567 RepID=UPI001A9CD2E4